MFEKFFTKAFWSKPRVIIATAFVVIPVATVAIFVPISLTRSQPNSAITQKPSVATDPPISSPAPNGDEKDTVKQKTLLIVGAGQSNMQGVHYKPSYSDIYDFNAGTPVYYVTTEKQGTTPRMQQVKMIPGEILTSAGGGQYIVHNYIKASAFYAAAQKNTSK